MEDPNRKTLSREVKGTLVPQGTEIDLAEGTEVTITHRLGGNFTVMTEFGMYRIGHQDADALGEDVGDMIPNASNIDFKGKPDEEKIWEHLRMVFDPEIPVNIVDLGLVYTMEIIDDDEEDKYNVLVNMTLTAPGCGMGPTIAEDARQRVMTVPGVNDAQVEIVWDPPWEQEMISEEGKMELGLI